MKIHYIETADGKLFSFYRHDYKIASDDKFIDGGFDYIRTNAKIEYGEIKDLIKDIREVFIWTSVYSKDGLLLEKPRKTLLKNLSSDHIIQILIYFTKRLEESQKVSEEWKKLHLIFLYELVFRQENEST